MYKLLAIIIGVALILAGCSKTPAGNARIAEHLLKDKGYRMISYEGNVQKYELTKDKLLQMPFSIVWGLQKVDPSKYIGKMIYVEKFIVKNHPLDNWKSKSSMKSKALGRTEVYVMVVDNKAIGGTSSPVLNERLTGGFWSLEGKTLEQIQVMSFSEWCDLWVRRYQMGLQ